MAYRRDLANSARRHLAAAQQLQDCKKPATSHGNNAVAGYLFGVAGELAVKQMMVESGMKPLDISMRNDDPFFAHFPKLRALLRNEVHGRRHRELLTLAQNDALFQHWDTTMRYAPSIDVQPQWTTSWRSQAEDLVTRMGL